MRRVLINGDDILMVGDSGLGSKWRKAADDVGLAVNESKTYESPRYALINSIFVDMIGRQEIRYMPLSVCIGHNVKKGEGIEETLAMIPQIWDLAVKAPKSKTWRERGADYLCKSLLLKRIPDLLPRPMKRFIPNYFINKALGGLGLEPDNDSWRITGDQRRVAAYFAEHRDETAIIEKAVQHPRAVSEALRKFRLIRPPTEEFLIDGKPAFGPLNEGEDADVVENECLVKCLQSTAWLKGCPKAIPRLILGMFKKALRSKAMMAKNKIKNFRLSLRRVVIPLLSKNKNIQERPLEIGDNYFTAEELDTAWKEYLDLDVVKLKGSELSSIPE